MSARGPPRRAMGGGGGSHGHGHGAEAPTEVYLFGDKVGWSPSPPGHADVESANGVSSQWHAVPALHFAALPPASRSPLPHFPKEPDQPNHAHPPPPHAPLQPGTRGVANWEFWEAPFYLCGVFSIYLAYRGVTEKPNLNFQDWARDEAEARNKRIEAGLPVKFGTWYGGSGSGGADDEDGAKTGDYPKRLFQG
jgi:hypothetical protein